MQLSLQHLGGNLISGEICVIRKPDGLNSLDDGTQPHCWNYTNYFWKVSEHASVRPKCKQAVRRDRKPQSFVSFGYGKKCGRMKCSP